GALATLAQVLMHQGRKDEAYQAAREAYELLESLGSVDEGEAHVRMVWAEALDVDGQKEAAVAAIRNAHERLMARAHKIADEAVRRTFLETVPANAGTLALYRRLVGET